MPMPMHASETSQVRRPLTWVTSTMAARPASSVCVSFGPGPALPAAGRPLGPAAGSAGLSAGGSGAGEAGGNPGGDLPGPASVRSPGPPSGFSSPTGNPMPCSCASSCGCFTNTKNQSAASGEGEKPAHWRAQSPASRQQTHLIQFIHIRAMPGSHAARCRPGPRLRSRGGCANKLRSHVHECQAQWPRLIGAQALTTCRALPRWRALTTWLASDCSMAEPRALPGPLQPLARECRGVSTQIMFTVYKRGDASSSPAPGPVPRVP